MNADAVQAAAEAVDGPGTSYIIQRGHISIDDVATMVAAAEPIIRAAVEAEYAERTDRQERWRVQMERDVRAQIAAVLHFEQERYERLATEARTALQPTLADHYDDLAEAFEDAACVARGGEA